MRTWFSLLLMAPVAALAATFSGPSLAPLGQPARFAGDGFALSVQVRVVTTTPSGKEMRKTMRTSAEGGLEFSWVPVEEGTYQIRVLDADGAQQAEARVTVFR